MRPLQVFAHARPRLEGPRQGTALLADHALDALGQLDNSVRGRDQPRIQRALRAGVIVAALSLAAYATE